MGVGSWGGCFRVYRPERLQISLIGIYLRYMVLQPLLECGTILLIVIEAPTVEAS